MAGRDAGQLGDAFPIQPAADGHHQGGIEDAAVFIFGVAQKELQIGILPNLGDGLLIAGVQHLLEEQNAQLYPQVGGGSPLIFGQPPGIDCNQIVPRQLFGETHPPVGGIQFSGKGQPEIFNGHLALTGVVDHIRCKVFGGKWTISLHCLRKWRELNNCFLCVNDFFRRP